MITVKLAIGAFFLRILVEPRHLHHRRHLDRHRCRLLLLHCLRVRHAWQRVIVLGEGGRGPVRQAVDCFGPGVHARDYFGGNGSYVGGVAGADDLAVDDAETG